MCMMDWIFLGTLILFALLGAIIGFGKCLKFLTGGPVGVIISLFICYSVGGLIMGIEPVQELLIKFAALWTDKAADNAFYAFLTKIHVEIIVYYIVLFFAVQLIRIIIVKILKSVLESQLLVFKIINKISGAALMVAVGLLLWLVAFQIIYWVQGPEGEIAQNYLLDGGLFHLNEIYLNNPLSWVIDYVQQTFIPSAPDGGEEAAIALMNMCSH